MKDAAAVELGRRGGKAGTGKAKKRGGADYYRKLAKRSWAKRKNARG